MPTYQPAYYFYLYLLVWPSFSLSCWSIFGVLISIGILMLLTKILNGGFGGGLCSPSSSLIYYAKYMYPVLVIIKYIYSLHVNAFRTPDSHPRHCDEFIKTWNLLSHRLPYVIAAMMPDSFSFAVIQMLDVDVFTSLISHIKTSFPFFHVLILSLLF